MLLVLLAAVLTAFTACGKKEFTVEIYRDGKLVETQTVAKGGTVSVPASLTRSFTVTGWKNGTADYDANAKVKKDLKLDIITKFSDDYKNDVYLNTEKYPDLNDQGLFWINWDTNTNMPVEKRVGTSGASAFADADKPTVIFVHGWLGTTPNAQTFHEMYPLQERLYNATDSDYFPESCYGADGKVYQTKWWLDEGWNVAVFTYNRFATAMIFEAESHIYNADVMRYQLNDGTWSDTDASRYSLCQFFAAEYLRAMDDMGAEAGKAETRITGHSLGGIMVTTTTNMLVELLKDGQVSEAAMPDRIALLDTYVSFSKGVDDLLNEEAKTITWSGAEYVNGSKSETYFDYIKNIDAHGIAIELCLMNFGTDGLNNVTSKFRVPLLSSDGMIWKVMDYAATVVYNPVPCQGDEMSSGHNATRDWYYASIRVPVLKLTGTNEEGISAASSTESIKANKGKVYVVDENDEFFQLEIQTEREGTKFDYVDPYEMSWGEAILGPKPE
jgi:hypothetical protein